MGRGPPERRKPRTPRSWTEQDMAAAIGDIRGGTTLVNAAAKWKIPIQTLRDRNSGKTKPCRQAHGVQQLLSQEGEAVLVAWLKLWADTARPLTIPRVQRIARDLSGGKVGKNWVDRFLKRHPELKRGKPSGLDPKHRVQNHVFLTRKLFKNCSEKNKRLYHFFTLSFLIGI